jgi:hypothetical protein
MAAYVPKFANDLFISYAHEDDKRWVQAFEDELRDEVSRRLGLAISVWQDTQRIRAGQNWQDAIRQGIQQSAAFLAIISPRYQNSRWCQLERNEFQSQFEARQFTACGRFFKAVKTPWPDNQHRLFLESIQDVDFFKDDEDGPREFTPGSREFKRAIRRLADGVEPLLRRMRRGNQRVHVAWPVEECLAAWEQLSDELRCQGFDVQPTGPRDASFSERLLLADMDRAVMSVHLLGSVHDPFTERMALLAADAEHQLVFWLASSAETTPDERQRALIEAIRSGVRPDNRAREWPQGWSLIADAGIRRFIDAVVTKLRPQPPAAPVPISTDVPTVYIVHDPTTAADSTVALELKEQIGRTEQMEVFVSRADLPSPTELKLWHENLLRSCDGVLLYRNAAPEGWWNQLAPEVILAERRFEREPIKSRAFLLPEPPAWEVGPDVKVIPYTPSFRLADLEPFLDPLRHGVGPAK